MGKVAIIIILLLRVNVSLANSKNLRAFESTKAVYISYTKPKGIYKRAHKACQKFFKRGVASERTSYSVEILTVVPKIKKASALCVSKKYLNDDVTRVSQF
ncbi:MAG: hypothetical protein ACRBBP_00215 [Bdellovibrionales bacterium]